MGSDDQVQVFTNEQKHEMIMTAEKGSRSVPVLNESVPSDCVEGFGMWSPVKKECVLCAFVASCFCRATDTPPRILEVTKKSRATRGASKGESTVKKSTNPFRQGSNKYVVREVLLAMAQAGTKRFTEEQGVAKAKELGHDLDPKKRDFLHVLWECEKSLWPLEKVPDHTKPLHGLIRFNVEEGQKPADVENLTIIIDVHGINSWVASLQFAESAEAQG